MRKLDNKGFAITGILYTLLILFLMILLSVLTGLSTRKTMLERSTESIESSYAGNINGSYSNVQNARISKKTPVTGKYIFEVFPDDNLDDKNTCVAYLNRNEELTTENLKDRLVPDDCNKYSYGPLLFRNDGVTPSAGLNLKLMVIYSFESE